MLAQTPRQQGGRYFVPDLAKLVVALTPAGIAAVPLPRPCSRKRQAAAWIEANACSSHDLWRPKRINSNVERLNIEMHRQCIGRWMRVNGHGAHRVQIGPASRSEGLGERTTLEQIIQINPLTGVYDLARQNRTHRHGPA